MAVTQVYLNIMRSIERVAVATLIYLISLLVNIGINALLIFGLYGAPKMGIVGAAIGTLCARITETVLVLCYAFFRNKTVRIRFRYFIRIDRVLLKDYMVYAMPVVLNELMWGLGSSANTAVIGHLGSAAVAANSVAQVARQLATVVVFGISHATAIYLGKTIGEKKQAHAKAYAKRFAGLSLILGAAGGAVILIAAPIANANLALSGKELSYFYVFRDVVFYSGAVMEYDYGGRNFSLRRRYKIRAYHGCVYHVGMFYFAGGSGSICVSCQCTCSLCDPDER